MDWTVIHSLLLLLISIFVVPNNTAESDCSVQCDATCNPPGVINCTVIKDCCTSVGSCPQTCQSLALPSDCNCHWEDICNTMINCCPQAPLTICLKIKLGNDCIIRRIQVCQTSVDMICGSTTTTSTEMSADSASPEPMTTLNTSCSGPDPGSGSGSGSGLGSGSGSGSGSGHDPQSSTSTEASTSSTPTETETTSSPTPDPTSPALTDSTTTEAISTSSDSTSSSESSASGVTSSQASAADDSTVEVAVLSCLAVLFVVVVVVAVFFWWRRKRQADGVSKENNPSCLSVETNLHPKQDSFNVYDKLCHDNRRTNIGNALTATANSRDNDNNDDYAYIDDPAINKGVVRLHEVTTDGQHALTDPSVSGLQPDLSSTYTLARPTDNIPDPQPPDYFILEEREKKGCTEPAQYFVLEERGEKNSAADTDTQQYFILEEKPEGEGGESASKHMSSRSEVDYFVLEKDDGQELDCADAARSDTSRAPPEEAEYSRLDPNSCQESDYTSLSRPPQPPDARGDNPYCLASHPE